MNKKIIRIFMSVLLVLVVVAAAAFSFASCDSNDAKDQNGTAEDTAADVADDSDGSGAPTGEKVTTVDVVDPEGNVTTFTITTSEEFLRGALEQEQLIEGDESEYGLYIKYVNGIRADYDKDGAYWALSKDGEYLMSGVDTTPVADGDHFELTYSK